MARFAIAGAALAAFLLAGAACEFAEWTRVKGPDGQRNWYAVKCYGPDDVPCYEMASQLCPRGYVMASSLRAGNVLIQCKDDSDGAKSAAGEQEQTEEQQQEAERAFAFCKSAYESTPAMAATWSDWFGGQALTEPPDRRQFMYLCGAVDASVRRCLDPEYARGSRDPCVAQFGKLSYERRRTLDRLFVTRADVQPAAGHE